MRARPTCCAPGAWGKWTLTCCVENVENAACVWPARSTHVATSCNNVARCVEMLQASGWALIADIVNWNQQMLVFEERAKPSTRRKTSRCRVENQQTQPTYDAESGNRTRVTLVGGECSHHCAIPAPQAWNSREVITIARIYVLRWRSRCRSHRSKAP